MQTLDAAVLRQSSYRNALRFAGAATVAATLAWFLYASVVSGWSRTTTDFPDYYTAARLLATPAPLSSYYDYPTFQREISRAGVGQQLGGYIPQTPLTMLPLLPVAFLDPLNAKRLWTLANLGFLGLAIWILSRVTRFSPAQLWLIAFLAYGALRQNFLLGQYYVLLFLLLTAAAYALLRSRDRPAGLALGIVLVLKLYGAPFALFLAAKRRMRGVVVIALVFLGATAAAGILFGWRELAYYATQILPRSISGETLNPFHPANNTFTTLLRRLFVAEPQMNPHPLADAPMLFECLRCVFTLAVLCAPVLTAWYDSGAVNKSDLAWWTIALLLASPNTASYTFVLLILPVALLLDEAPRRYWPLILLPYVALTLPVRGNWALLFPKAWLLLILFIEFRPRSAGRIPRTAVASMAAIILAIGVVAATRLARSPERPAADAVQIFSQSDSVYSNSPIATRTGVFYETIAQERYCLVRRNDNSAETFALHGHAFHPSSPDDGNRIYFELVSGGGSSIGYVDVRDHSSGVLKFSSNDQHDPAVSHDGKSLMFVSAGDLFLRRGDGSIKFAGPAARDPSFLPGDSSVVVVTTGTTRSQIVQMNLQTAERVIVVDGEAQFARPSVSPDGNRLAYASRQTGPWQIRIKDLASGRDFALTQGPCNSAAPTWTTDSRSVIFASDCNRGLNLPALFRVAVPR